MACCICGKNVAGLPVMRDDRTGLECCEACGRNIGGPTGFIRYVDSLQEENSQKVSLPSVPIISGMFKEAIEEAGKDAKQSTDKKSGCFIATAVYGSAEALEVNLFKRYRDEFLQSHLLGRIFIKIYYLISPYLSKLIANSSFLREFTRRYILLPIFNRLVRLFSN